MPGTGPFLPSYVRCMKMKYAHSAARLHKGATIAGAAIFIIRGVINFPSALVDAIEKLAAYR